MEKYFKPLHSPSTLDEIEPQKHHHHHHHLHHHQDTESHGFTKFYENERNKEQGHSHHHEHHNAHHQHHHHHPQRPHHAKEDEILYDHHTPVTLSRASSSFSSSSSSSSSLWYTEASENDPVVLGDAKRQQHSLSCSNIPDVRRDFREDDGSEPIVFVTIKHGDAHHHLHGKSQQREQQSLSSLHRGHSRSDEGPLQSTESDLGEEQHRDTSHLMDYGPLYKTVSLNRSLAFSDEDILPGVSRGPKRAVSSSQLPSKGILKNREPPLDIRKAKSMEVLSPRVAKGQNENGEKRRGITKAELEHARENFLQTKLQFSAFLDEITKQVISPSDLSILGVNSIKTSGKTSVPAQTADPVKPQLPPKKHSSGEEREHHSRQSSAQEEAARSKHRSHSRKHSNPDKLTAYGARNHSGSPPPHRSPQPISHNTPYGSSRKDRKSSPTKGPRDRDGRCGTHRIANPEPNQPEQRHRYKQQPTASHVSPPHPHHFHQHQPEPPGPNNSSTSPTQFAGAGHGSESSSSKSDSSRAGDTDFTAASHSPEHRAQTAYVGQCKQHRDTLCDADHLQALQDENADLHQNLLQTVVCIESLEVELQRTRDELSHVKAKYKSLLETHTGTRQANNLLGEHLHIASESLSSERTGLLNRVTQLSSELQDAHRTIAALENINVPCLIKELVEKHFDSAEATQTLLKLAASVRYSATSPQLDSRSLTPKKDEAAHDWLTKPEAGPQRLTAFMPWKQGGPTTDTENQHDSSPRPPISAADITTALCKTMTATPQLPYQDQQQPPLGTNNADRPPNLHQANVSADSGEGRGGVKAADSEQDTVGATSASAQQFLDDFMQQLHTHKEPGGERESGRVGKSEGQNEKCEPNSVTE